MKQFMLIFGLMTLAGFCQAIEMPQSAKERGCTACHTIDRKLIGPAWIDVSRRYRDMRDSKDVFEQLVKKVSLGGHGNWGDIPMAANDPMGRHRDEIVALVKFVLSLSDQLPEKK
jgi:cytochrome c